MRDSREELGICIPKFNRMFVRLSLYRYAGKVGEEADEKHLSDTIRIENLYLIVIILFIGIVWGSILTMIQLSLPIFLILFGCTMFFASFLFYYSFMEFILLGERRIVSISATNIQSIDLGRIREVVAITTPSEGLGSGTLYRRETLEMSIIQKDDFKKLRFSALVKPGKEEEEKIMGELSRYFKRYTIKFNSSSPQYYLELFDRKTLSDEEIESSTAFIDEELSDPGASDHVFKVKGLWHQKLKDHTEAIEWLGKYIQYHPDDREVLIALVESLEALESYLKAVTFTTAMFSQFPEDSEIIGIHGKMLYLAGKQGDGLGYIRAEVRRLQAIADSKQGLRRKLKYYEKIGQLSQLEKDLVQ